MTTFRPRLNQLIMGTSAKEALAKYSWVKGPAIHYVYWYTNQVDILCHVGGGAYSVVQGRDYLACCPTLKAARKFATEFYRVEMMGPVA